MSQLTGHVLILDYSYKMKYLVISHLLYYNMTSIFTVLDGALASVSSPSPDSLSDRKA